MGKNSNTKRNNQVRIIGGTHRGRKIAFADAEGLRPTPDMVREKLFNWLGQNLTGQKVLDLFSGSGALGFEAASRHAQRVVMVENNRATLQTLRNGVRDLGLAQIETVGSDGLLYLKNHTEQFDVVFLDPPFAWWQWAELFQYLQARLADGAAVYIEAGALPETPAWLQPYRSGAVGKSRFELFVYTQVAE
ncbi:16S rRNA (guanine(966)-N(2))-methyltransferase RsmD [Neisseria chenwenguii]|uniref:16S rRNA (Guanine(966)-N(2))-methyltransferase RsmD n=1 Tax=Neisseria chenwenguii TaxID=1853278 RepID=A0A220S154_9NEIS|nr:16S rRNA (guanine(966)-N(2))-methyltransferase RsmD [Neisseria chenwenguii]ASK27211.1 16S rRNA (guanine(966)-N(2))-methyltransferase RsmD [Neisseria chenwenguii]ROV54844.1 16S rRNA (guanine(966)-N(2))-methyltransferase RsmD [Neisseria chenwenguii]